MTSNIEVEVDLNSFESTNTCNGAWYIANLARLWAARSLNSLRSDWNQEHTEAGLVEREI